MSQRRASKSVRDFCAATYQEVENGHTVPSIDTLEKWARALEVPMYRLFTDEDPREDAEYTCRSHTESGGRTRSRTVSFRLSPSTFHVWTIKDRGLLIHIASKMASRSLEVTPTTEQQSRRMLLLTRFQKRLLAVQMNPWYVSPESSCAPPQSLSQTRL